MASGLISIPQLTTTAADCKSFLGKMSWGWLLSSWDERRNNVFRSADFQKKTLKTVNKKFVKRNAKIAPPAERMRDPRSFFFTKNRFGLKIGNFFKKEKEKERSEKDSFSKN